MPRSRRPTVEQTQEERDRLARFVTKVRLPDGDTAMLPSMALTLETLGLRLGDLVQLGGQGLNSGGVVWRIVHDSRPRGDAVLRKRYGLRMRHLGAINWCDPRTQRPLSDLALRGFVKIEPVFCFMPFVPKKELSPWGMPRAKSVPYHQVQTRLRRVDVMELGAKWAELRDIIEQTVKERSE